MLGIHDLWLFIVSGVLFNMAPGPDVLYVASRSAGYGARAGMVAALGIGAGCCVHIVAAAVGLTAVLAASATAFWVIKIVGALYLVYAGLRMLFGTRKARQDGQTPAALRPSLKSIFVQGFFTNALNPKVALFFLAFLPQFIAADAPHKPLAFAVLGIILNCTGTAWNMLLAWSTVRLTRGLGRIRRFFPYFSYGTGALFVLFGLRLALADDAAQP